MTPSRVQPSYFRSWRSFFCLFFLPTCTLRPEEEVKKKSFQKCIEWAWRQASQLDSAEKRCEILHLLPSSSAVIDTFLKRSRERDGRGRVHARAGVDGPWLER